MKSKTNKNKLVFIKVRKEAFQEYSGTPDFELTDERIEIPEKTMEGGVLEELRTDRLGKINKLTYGNRTWFFVGLDHPEVLEMCASDPDYAQFVENLKIQK